MRRCIVCTPHSKCKVASRLLPNTGTSGTESKLRSAVVNFSPALYEGKWNVSRFLCRAGRPGHNLRKKVKMSTCGGIVLDKTGAGMAANSEFLPLPVHITRSCFLNNVHLDASTSFIIHLLQCWMKLVPALSAPSNSSLRLAVTFHSC